MVQQYAEISSAINKLNNGNFDVLPYSFVKYKQYRYDDASSGVPSGHPYLLSPQMMWIKERYRKKTLLTTTPDNTGLPGWACYCSSDEGASLDFDLMDNVTGIRQWSRDGGHVCFVSFKDDCTVTLEQTLYSFNEFPLQDVTFGYSVYPTDGTPNIVVNMDFSDTVTEVISNTYVGNFGRYFRVAESLQCPGAIDKFVIRFTIIGKSGETCGITGLTLLLGDQRPQTPYVDNPMPHTIPSGTIILTEGDCPEGYVELAGGYMFYQTYGDPTSLTGAPAAIVEWDAAEIQDVIGTKQHSAHEFDIPFVPLSGEGWITDEAWRGIRVKGLDLADRGYNNRKPSGTFAVEDLDVGFVGGWHDILSGPSGGFRGLTAPTGVLPLVPGSVIDLTINEFSRSIRALLCLPANTGTSFATSGDTPDDRSARIDDWNSKHMHYIIPKEEETLPPYKSFRACMKI